MFCGYTLRLKGDPILVTRSYDVKDFSDLGRLLDDMRQAMRDYRGIGLAAPQIGDLRRVAIAEIDNHVAEFVNPYIAGRGLLYIPRREGCLSLPKTEALKIRKYSIYVEYSDRQGTPHRRHLSGCNAVILQHEIDHLDGKLIK